MCAVMSINFFRDSIQELRMKQGSMSATMLYTYQVGKLRKPKSCISSCHELGLIHSGLAPEDLNLAA